MKITHLHIVLFILASNLLLKYQADSQGYTPEYERRADVLRMSPPKDYAFSKAVLGDVLRFLALDADISFFTMPDGSAGLDKLVTFKIRSSPFQALETLAKANGLVLVYDGGIWYIRPSNDGELIGRVYLIKYNTGEGGSIGQGESQIVQDIQTLMGMNTGPGDAKIVKEIANVDTFNYNTAYGNDFDSEILGGRSKPNIVDNEDNSRDKGSSQILWNSETNTLTVVATRQQHQWIEAYLTTVDKPQSMIAIEAKFFETNRNPERTVGLNWGGSGYEGEKTNLIANTLGTGGLDLALNTILGGGLLGADPVNTILSKKQAKLALNAIYKDGDTVSVSYPRVITRNGKEVSINSQVSVPVLSTSTSVNTGVGGDGGLGNTGAASTASIQTVNVGTTLTVTPKKLFNGDILMDLDIDHKEIVDNQVINGQSYPVVDSRTYKSPVQVKSGYTVAIAGLDRASLNESRSGVPFLAELPLLGALFREQKVSDQKRHMMMFITPSIISPNAAEQGITERPLSVGNAHKRKNMDVPSFNPDGTVKAGNQNTDYLIDYYNNEIDNLDQIIAKERMGTEENYHELNFIIRSCESMITRYNRGQSSSNYG